MDKTSNFRSKGFIYNKVVKDHVKREVIVQHDIIFSKVNFKND